MNHVECRLYHDAKLSHELGRATVPDEALAVNRLIDPIPVDSSLKITLVLFRDQSNSTELDVSDAVSYAMYGRPNGTPFTPVTLATGTAVVDEDNEATFIVEEGDIPDYFANYDEVTVWFDIQKTTERVICYQTVSFTALGLDSSEEPTSSSISFVPTLINSTTTLEDTYLGWLILLLDASGGDFTLNLMSAALRDGIRIDLMKILASGNVTIHPAGVETINERAGDIVLATGYKENMALISYDGNWIMEVMELVV